MAGTMEQDQFEAIRKTLRPFFLKRAVQKAVLFGSLATGKGSRKSDFDLMIVKQTEKRFFDRFEEFTEIHELIRDRAVDLLIYTPEELESIAHRSFVKRILQEGKVLYEL